MSANVRNCPRPGRFAVHPPPFLSCPQMFAFVRFPGDFGILLTALTGFDRFWRDVVILARPSPSFPPLFPLSRSWRRAQIFYFFEPASPIAANQSNSPNARNPSDNDRRTTPAGFDGYCSALAKPTRATITVAG